MANYFSTKIPKTGNCKVSCLPLIFVIRLLTRRFFWMLNCVRRRKKRNLEKTRRKRRHPLKGNLRMELIPKMTRTTKMWTQVRNFRASALYTL